MFHVKHSEPYSALEAEPIRRLLVALGLNADEQTVHRLLGHANMVLDWNTRVNLTRIVEPAEVERLHIADSLAFLMHVGPLDAPIVDIGSGAGYPGIPVAVVTGMRVCLCESVGKKAAFLQAAIAALGIDADVFAGRAERYADQHREVANTVLARAVSSLPSLVELASPLLQPGGRLMALKGSPGEQELHRGRAAAGLCGMSEASVTEYGLPGGDESRCVVVYEKVGRPTVKLPRREGMAQRDPLA
jgi:16S rRNA (guanine527-N7)-methyltransferase